MFLNDEVHLRTSYGLLLKNPKNKEMYMRELDTFDALFIPGGPGTPNVDKDPNIDKILEHFVKHNKVIGTICAAPTLLAKRGYLKDKKAICFNDKKLRAEMINGGAIIENPNCD
jgi:4-methyl-5(b-hydroxyethyl)-thiazole monophosphate biosynthesis